MDVQFLDIYVFARNPPPPVRDPCMLPERQNVGQESA